MEDTIPVAPSTARDMCLELRTCSKNKGERWKLEALHWAPYCATEIWLLNHSDNILCLISANRLLRSSPGHTVSLFNNSIGDICGFLSKTYHNINSQRLVSGKKTFGPLKISITCWFLTVPKTKGFFVRHKKTIRREIKEVVTI